MISKKMQAMTANSSVIRAMFEEGARLAKEYGAENVFDFSIGNPSVTPPPQVAPSHPRLPGRRTTPAAAWLHEQFRL